MKKPLSITSPTHAVALAVYFILGILGLFYTVGVTKSNALAAAVGQGLTDLWGASLMICGFGAFLSAIAAGRARAPEANLRLEMIFCIGLFLNMGLFMYIAYEAVGAMALGAIVQAGAFGVGSFFRALQIAVEQRMIKKAKSAEDTDGG